MSTAPFQRRALFCACLLLAAPCLSAPLGAVGWPVPSPVIVGTFGEDRGDHFSNGVDLGGAGQPVRPALDGEVIFRYDGLSAYSSLPRGTGAMVAIRHPQNILTVYTHLAEGSLGVARPAVTAADILGIIGESGRAEGALLHFAVYDTEAGSWVNPFSFLPLLADHQAPVIRRVVLAVGDQKQELTTGAPVRPGKAAVLVEAWDLREDVRFFWPLAPYSLRLALDGTEVSRLSFDTLAAPRGTMLLGPSGLRRADLYPGDSLVQLGTVDLQPGDSHILVAVRDYAGNEATRDIAVTVQR